MKKMFETTRFALQYAVIALQEHLGYTFAIFAWDEFDGNTPPYTWTSKNEGVATATVDLTFNFRVSASEVDRVVVGALIEKSVNVLDDGRRVKKYRLIKLLVTTNDASTLTFLPGPDVFTLVS